jgi:hypothetical protein
LIVTTPLGGVGAGVGAGAGAGAGVGVGAAGFPLESVELPQPHAVRLNAISTLATITRMSFPLSVFAVSDFYESGTAAR